MYKIYRKIYFVVRDQKYRMFVSNFTLCIVLCYRKRSFLRYFFLSEDCVRKFYIYAFLKF